ncbi:MAG: hypothetical protein QUV08_07640 [Parasphingorhabdus sp.]|nr:hypothetical protein [Parasphingorhabdus sp.]
MIKFIKKYAGQGAFILASTAMFLLACYSLYFDRTATAAVAAALSLAFVIIQKLPLIENLEILTLKVKLRHQVSEATQLLEKLRASAVVSSKLSYVQLAFMNRMGSLPWGRKRELQQEIDAMLSNLDGDSVTIAEAKAPLLTIVSFDLYQIFAHSVTLRVQKRRSELDKAIQEHFNGKPIVQLDETYQKLSAERKSLDASRKKFSDVLYDPRLRDLEKLTEKDLPLSGLNKSEIETLETIRKEVCDLSKKCWNVQTITTETEDYLEKYQQGDTRVRELFDN